MVKSRRGRSKPFTKAKCKSISITRNMSFPARSPRGKFWRELAKEVRGFPTGRQTPWGIPFNMARPGAKARVILVREGGEVTVSVGARADYLCVLHMFRKADEDKTTYVESDPVGEYVFRYAGGSSHTQPIRARLDVNIPESPGPAQMSMPFTMPTTIDPVAPPQGKMWGAVQRGVEGGLAIRSSTRSEILTPRNALRS